MLLWIGGAGIGILFFFISKYTREAIGYGDSWIILLLGIYLGLWDLLWLLSIAFTVTGVLAVFLLAFRKCSRKITIPFVPFLTLAYVGVMYL